MRNHGLIRALFEASFFALLILVARPVRLLTYRDVGVHRAPSNCFGRGHNQPDVPCDTVTDQAPTLATHELLSPEDQLAPFAPDVFAYSRGVRPADRFVRQILLSYRRLSPSGAEPN